MPLHIAAMIAALVLAHTVESILGFGATIIAFGIGVHFFPVNTLVVMLVIIAIPQSVWLVVRWFRYIEWHRIYSRIVPISLVGVIAGIILRNHSNESLLKLILGVFIMSISVMELIILFTSRGGGNKRLPSLIGNLLILTGGVFHGLLAIGAPLIVYYAGRELSSQKSIRGTLSFVWLLLNGVMITSFIITGKITGEIMKTTALLFPGLLMGIALGNALRISDFHFRIVTYVLLFCIGASLVL